MDPNYKELKGKYLFIMRDFFLSIEPTWTAELRPVLESLREAVGKAQTDLDEHKKEVALAEADLAEEQKKLRDAEAIHAFHTCDGTRLAEMQLLYQCELGGLKQYTDGAYPQAWGTWLDEHTRCTGVFAGHEDCQRHLPV